MKALELRVLEMCEELFPKSPYKDNKKLKQLLIDIRKELEAK
jgi:hypothetical protein